MLSLKKRKEKEVKVKKEVDTWGLKELEKNRVSSVDFILSIENHAYNYVLFHWYSYPFSSILFVLQNNEVCAV